MKADCFVLVSRTEGMPIALLEAMASSLPIVTTSVGSIPIVVRNNVEAIVIKPNSEEEICKAIYRILTDRKLQEKLSYNARKKYLSLYTADLMADKYKAHYEQLLADV